jgi:TRAP-type C4-dicarboxylate transport system permease small subunit
MQEPVGPVDLVRELPGFGPWGRRLLALSRGWALAGSLVFVVLVVLSIVSIVGRKLAAAPVPGDVEILQMAAACACASFFAMCHLTGGDVKVDFFTARARARTLHRLDAFGSLLTGLVGAVLAWRTGASALAMHAAGETSVILAWPVWIAQALMVPGFALMGAAGFYMVGAHLRRPAVGLAVELKP